MQKLYTAPGLDSADNTGTGTAQASVILDTASQVNTIYDVKVTETGLVSVNALYKAAGTIMTNVAKTNRPSVVDLGSIVGYDAAGGAQSNLPRFLGANSKNLIHVVTNTNVGGFGGCTGLAGGHGSFPYISVGGVYPDGRVVFEVTASGDKFPYAGVGPYVFSFHFFLSSFCHLFLFLFFMFVCRCNYVMAPAFNIKAASHVDNGTAFLRGPPA